MGLRLDIKRALKSHEWGRKHHFALILFLVCLFAIRPLWCSLTFMGFGFCGEKFFFQKQN
jgi:hypothetical protein